MLYCVFRIPVGSEIRCQLLVTVVKMSFDHWRHAHVYAASVHGCQYDHLFARLCQATTQVINGGDWYLFCVPVSLGSTGNMLHMGLDFEFFANRNLVSLGSVYCSIRLRAGKVFAARFHKFTYADHHVL